MAVFPQSTRSEDERVLTYITNTAQPDENNPNQHCLILPIYGEITGFVHTPNPAATRQWLSAQRGAYQERWHDGVRRLLSPEPVPAAPQQAGQYIVGIATTIEDIPKTVYQLSRWGSGPMYAPSLSDRALDLLQAHYTRQPGDTPQFVVGVHATTPDGPEAKDPITVRYTQFPNCNAFITLPGLQYDGGPHLEKYTSRNHNLLLATNLLYDIFAGTLPPGAGKLTRNRPAELGNAPIRFPLQIIDTRRGHGRLLKPEFAPNVDYMFDIHSIQTALRKARTGLANLPIYQSPDQQLSDHTYRSSISRKVITQIGSRGLMSYSNQPAKNTDAYRNAGDASAKTLDTSNLGD